MSLSAKDIVQIKSELNLLTTQLLKAYHDSETRYTEEKIKSSRDLEEQNSVNGSLVSLVEENEQKMYSLDKVVESKNETISRLQSEVDAFKVEITDLKREKSNSERHDMLKAQANEIMDKCNEIDRLNRLLSKKNKNVEMVVKDDEVSDGHEKMVETDATDATDSTDATDATDAD